MGSNPIPENEIFSILFLRSGSCAVRHIFSICILVRTTLHHILFTYLIKHTNPLQLLIPTTSVLRITKEKVARIIPNAVGVCTRDERHVFGSLLSRDSTYKLMTHVWKATKAPELAVPKPEVCELYLSLCMSIYHSSICPSSSVFVCVEDECSVAAYPLSLFYSLKDYKFSIFFLFLYFLRILDL